MLYLDLVEAWVWDHIQKQDDIDKWLAELNAPPRMDWAAEAAGIIRRGCVGAMRRFLIKLGSGDGPVDNSPPGWSDDELLAEALRVTGSSATIDG